MAGPDAGWGYSVTVYGYRDTNNNLWTGSVQLSGVQFTDAGQLDTLNAPLRFLNSIGTTKSNVVDSSFVNCKANCIKIDNSRNIALTSNVLYSVWVVGIWVDQSTDITISSNIIMGVKGRPTVSEGAELIACMAIVNYPDPLVDKVLVRDNFCQGSTQHGYAFTMVKCD